MGGSAIKPVQELSPLAEFLVAIREKAVVASDWKQEFRRKGYTVLFDDGLTTISGKAKDFLNTLKRLPLEVKLKSEVLNSPKKLAKYLTKEAENLRQDGIEMAASRSSWCRASCVKIRPRWD